MASRGSAICVPAWCPKAIAPVRKERGSDDKLTPEPVLKIEAVDVEVACKKLEIKVLVPNPAFLAIHRAKVQGIAKEKAAKKSAARSANADGDGDAEAAAVDCTENIVELTRAQFAEEKLPNATRNPRDDGPRHILR
ncbi:unnamed protein product [Prorocentrum cordatum]|nr:unnamed protein product [Polarella glacialis]|mmetsp:Transcript_35384/g.92530  ORF Transcript_35384/g.92530 Transcript_35384/m.92530 type:complete len:137 (+) Transcript_35384:45-455(+)